MSSSNNTNNNNVDEEFDDDAEFINEDEIEDQIILDEEDFNELVEQMEGGDGDEEQDGEMEVDDDEDIPDDSVARMDKHTDAIYAIDLFEHKDYTMLVTGSGDDTGYVYKFDPSTKEIGGFQHLTGHKDTIMDVQFNFDGTKVATGGMDGLVGVWDVSDPENVKNIEFYEGPGESVEWIDWHPKGNLLACGSSDTTAWLWNVKTGKCLNVFAGHAGPITCGGFTSDGKLLVTGSEDASVRIWNPVTAECIHVFQHETMFLDGPITAFASQKQEPNLILTGCEDGSVALSHIGNKKVIGILKEHKDSIESVAFSSFASSVPVAPMMATAGMDKLINLWDVSTLTKRQTMAHEDGVIKVLFDDNQPLVYSCSVDRTVSVWDVRTGKPVQVFRGHRNLVLDFVKSSDSTHIFTAADDGKSLVFALNK